MVLKGHQAIDRFLLRVVDGGLAGVIFVVPLLMGGRHAIGQLGLTIFAVAAAWAWAARQCLQPDARWRPLAVAPLLLLGLALVVLQIVPLPPWLLARLSPATARALPLWAHAGNHRVVWALELHLLYSRRDGGGAGDLPRLRAPVPGDRPTHTTRREHRTAAALVRAVGGGDGGVRHRAESDGQRQVLLVLRAPLLRHLPRRQRELRQPQPLRRVPGPGRRAADLVAARRHAASARPSARLRHVRWSLGIGPGSCAVRRAALAFARGGDRHVSGGGHLHGSLLPRHRAGRPIRRRRRRRRRADRAVAGNFRLRERQQPAGRHLFRFAQQARRRRRSQHFAEDHLGDHRQGRFPSPPAGKRRGQFQPGPGPRRGAGHGGVDRRQREDPEARCLQRGRAAPRAPGRRRGAPAPGGRGPGREGRGAALRPRRASLLAAAGVATQPASAADFTAEFLDLVVAVRIVDSLDEAVAVINRDGSAHSDAIVTADGAAAERFMAGVDSAAVFWNASTRFNDGFEFGFGAEIGISTDRLHARGPMGLRELCSYKWLVTGTGQVRT